MKAGMILYAAIARTSGWAVTEWSVDSERLGELIPEVKGHAQLT